MAYKIPKEGSVVFTDIQQIRDHDWFGSYAFDQAAFHAVDQFVLNETNSYADRAEAIKLASRDGMGEDIEDEWESDQEMVDEYIKTMDE